MEIKKCPFDGGVPDKWYDMQRIGKDIHYSFFIACRSCGVKKCSHISFEDVENIWNTRYDETKEK